MKFFLNTLFIGLMLFSASCNRDKCEKITCPTGKVCHNGQCLCPNGWEGNQCDIRSSIKFVGNYQVNQNCQGAPSQSYNVYIQETSRIDRVIITNMLNSGLYVEAIISDIYIEIPDQQIGGTSIEGYGTYNRTNQQIQISFTYSHLGSHYVCDGFFFKQ